MTSAPAQHWAKRRLRAWLAVAGILCAAGAVYHFGWRQHVRRFQVVHAGVLYRMAQPSEWGVRYLVHRYGVKTVLNLRVEDEQLRRGLLGVGGPKGEPESQFVTEMGISHRQWPMGPEACWPWVTPLQFEEFYRLFDARENWPVAVHCVSGRHRTGTITALFRLEYDRWPIDRVLSEMYTFDFGAPIPLQEINLRTYVPRPLPSDAEWIELRDTWRPFCSREPTDFTDMVYQLRTVEDQAAVRRLLVAELKRTGTFALPMACRLIDSPDDPAAMTAAEAADHCLQAETGSEADLLAAAALVADFGTPEEQDRLLDTLRTGAQRQTVTSAFHAVAAGIANRYTGNRVSFLAVLLDDERIMPGTGSLAIRYCDMAVAHLSAIVDERLLNAGSSTPSPQEWEAARAQAKAWVDRHPQVARLGQRIAPAGQSVVR